MTIQVGGGVWRTLAALGAVCCLMSASVYPAWAVKVVRSKAQQVETDKKNDQVTTAPDSSRTKANTLLDDIESQKTEGATADSSGYDSWIDRDGDGVNDNMKSFKESPEIKTKVKQAEVAPKTQNIPVTKTKNLEDLKKDTTSSKRRR